MKTRLTNQQAELCSILRELNQLRADTLAMVFERKGEDIDDAEKAKMFSLLESFDPMISAIQAIRMKLDQLEESRRKMAQ